MGYAVTPGSTLHELRKQGESFTLRKIILMAMRSRSRARLFGALTVFTVAVTLIAARGLPVHADLESSVPKDRDTLTTAPQELRFKFTEPPELAVTKVKLHGPGGTEIPLGKLKVVDAAKVTVVAPIAGILGPGLQTVDWETAGEDGHVVDGFLVFTVLPGATSASTDGGGGRRGSDTMTTHHDTVSMPHSADRFDAESAGYVLVRFAFYTALLIVMGAVAFRAVVLPLVLRRPDATPAFVASAAQRAATLGWTTGWVLLAVCVARLIAQSLALNGSAEVFDPSRIGVLIGDTQWGRAWLVQVAATMVALYGFRAARPMKEKAKRKGERLLPPSSRMGWIVAGIAALVLAFTPAFSGHAAATPNMRTLALLFDGLHVLGAAGWIGSLFMVLACGIPAAMALTGERRGPAVRDLINAFSPTALVFAALVVATGVFAAWVHVGTFAGLWESKYGNLLLTKLAVLSAVALTGAYNWRRVKPSLGTVQGAARIRRSATVEVVVAVAILVITAILVAAPPPASGAM